MNKVTAGWWAMRSVLGVPWWALLVGAAVLITGVLAWLRYLASNPSLTKDLKPSVAEPRGAGQQTGDFPPEEAAPAPPDPVLIAQHIASLHEKATRTTATNTLVALGDGVLPALQEGLLLATDELPAQRLAQVCAQLGSPAARQALIAVVQAQNLLGRAAALRALSNLAAVPADAPLFQRVVEKELRLAQQLLHGMVDAVPDWQDALRYELRRNLQRLFGLLLQLYERQPLLDVQRSVAHFANERQASPWQALENLLPRPLYQGLHALLGEGRIRHRAQVLDDLLGPLVPTESVQTLVVRGGLQAFSAWTINVALRQWHPQPATVGLLYPHLLASNALVREGAWEVLRRLPVQRPAAYDQLLAAHPGITDLLAASPGPLGGEVSVRERVLLLKATPLFSETPENVLADIVPVVREVRFQPNQEIFAKGALEASLFVIGEGEVAIFNDSRQLASFNKGDFFGELALLDAEPRSATAIACTPTVAFRLDQEDFYNVLAARPEVLHTIMKALCQRLRRQNEQSLVAVAQCL
ncbi:cyclic nucleotide-binding domain-containing protein [Hymenobacter sp. BT186]|uniref:Cyclic nucleotide-binding domain-containing protein n=1 Tax=Hymenobacter telluris TaxID=2816474 RepID=A0A939EVL7_9BACT|nr:cyclic nucleotide-binding domain-containing protein [Hymenobacter telluris]MBO0358036.1 cyclic nucleotide-binding domain-containing protein [Hymenobacter telluris]MBW3374063.1 cyclic nucleotide-binding domain-containing protein [Hymenobacter norwichensis]